MAIAAAIFISFLNYLGVKKAGEFQLVFTVLKVAIILGIVVVCFSGSAACGRGWSNFAGTFAGAKGGMAGFMAALVAALWAYDGWNDLNMVAGEVKHPERNIPIALIAGVATVGVLYMLVNAGVQYVLPANAIAASPRPASDAVALVDWGRMGARHRLSAGHGALHAGHAEWHDHERGARALCRGAGRIFLSRAGGSASPVSHALGGDCGTGGVVDRSAAAGRNFRQLFSLAIFAEWLFYMIAGSTVFVFRRRDPQAARPYRMLGISLWCPPLFVAVAAALLYYTFRE